MATQKVGYFPTLQLLSTWIHGVVDYLTGALLILAPFVLGFNTGGPEQWVPIVLGVTAVLYSLATRYELGLYPIISMPIHLLLDAGSGVFLAASPWLFGFSDQITWPHVVVGLFEVMMSVITQTKPSKVRK